MERGIVTKVGKNKRGNRYGFIQSDGSGGDCHFSQYGVARQIVTTGVEPRFRRTWSEVGDMESHVQPFPEVDDVLYFDRDPARNGKNDTAGQWCTQATFRQAELLIKQRFVPEEARGAWEQFNLALQTWRGFLLNDGLPVLIENEARRINVLYMALLVLGTDVEYLRFTINSYRKDLMSSVLGDGKIPDVEGCPIMADTTFGKLVIDDDFWFLDDATDYTTIPGAHPPTLMRKIDANRAKEVISGRRLRMHVDEPVRTNKRTEPKQRSLSWFGSNQGYVT